MLAAGCGDDGGCSVTTRKCLGSAQRGGKPPTGRSQLPCSLSAPVLGLHLGGGTHECCRWVWTLGLFPYILPLCFLLLFIFYLFSSLFSFTYFYFVFWNNVKCREKLQYCKELPYFLHPDFLNVNIFSTCVFTPSLPLHMYVYSTCTYYVCTTYVYTCFTSFWNVWEGIIMRLCA